VAFVPADAHREQRDQACEGRQEDRIKAAAEVSLAGLIAITDS
jgi:hypothetical protein